MASSTEPSDSQLPEEPGSRRGSDPEAGEKAKPGKSHDERREQIRKVLKDVLDPKAFEGKDVAELKKRHKEIDRWYTLIAEEFADEADGCTIRFDECARKNRRWRILMAVFAGILAIFNVGIAYTSGFGEDTHWTMEHLLPIVAAVWAVIIGVFANIQAIFAYQDRALEFRELREVYLNAYRDAAIRWQVHVLPHGYTSEGCYCAAMALMDLLNKDAEVRRKAMTIDIRGREKKGGHGASAA